MLSVVQEPSFWIWLSGNKLKTSLESEAIWYLAYARLGQGWGKVWTKSKVRARSGQARSGQGWGNGARLGQGWGKVWTKSKVRARSRQASCDTNVFYSYHSPKSISLSLSPYLFPAISSSLPRPCPNLAFCPDLAPTLPQPCLPRPCPNLAFCPDLARTLPKTLPQPCPNLAPTLPQPCVGQVSNCRERKGISK